MAAEHAPLLLFDPHATYGITMAYESAMMRPKLPLHEVLRMSLLGNWERMTAQRALQVGLVTEVVPLSELSERAAWVAHAIASAPPTAIQATLRAVWAAEELSRFAGSGAGLGLFRARQRPARDGPRRRTIQRPATHPVPVALAATQRFLLYQGNSSVVHAFGSR